MTIALRFSEKEVGILKGIFEMANSRDLPVTFYVGEAGADVAYGGIFRGFDMGILKEIGDRAHELDAGIEDATVKYTNALVDKPSGNPYANISDDNPIVVELKKLVEAVNRLNPQRMATDNHYSR